MINLKGNPFYLDEDGIKWVENTLATMTTEEKIGQLFCLIHRSEDNWRQEADYVLKFQPGGSGYRPMASETVWTVSNYYQGKSKIPMLMSANLERGGSGIVKEGTNFACNMQVAATADPKMAKWQGFISAKEALAVGGNWAFAPQVDIDYNFRNPITNTRTYGANPELVIEMGKAYVQAVQSEGVVASIKHFPGDGRDERDQHLVTTINDMSCEEWDATYGKIYKECIEAGTLTIMPGHIMLPAYSQKLRPGIKDEDILPATMAPELLNDLLRNQLGFNGMIVSDATTMVGMLVPLPREEAVPQVIAAGCDMFLFARNLEEDFGYMLKGYQNGLVTEQRLNDAVTRILAVKAAIGLHKKQKEGQLVPPSNNLSIIGCDEHIKMTRECADQSITLVKSDGKTLPLDPQKGKRLLLYSIGDEAGPHNPTGGKFPHFKEKLENEGFIIDIFEPSKALELRTRRYDEVVSKYDVIIYFCAIMTKSNQTTVRIEWLAPLGANCPVYLAKVPTIFISMENPYHLLDVPRVKNFINAYTNTTENIDALIEKLLGRSEFKGKSPIDPFCGRWDTHL